MMFKRVMGKASFCNVQDKEGRIQVYVARDDLGEEAYKEFKRMDIGDIIGVKGFVFKTKTGEISVHAKELTLLSKSLTPLPEKFHGLQDTDLRYRQRYVDLIMNEESKETFIKRSKIISEIRKFPMRAALRHVLLRLISTRWTRMSSSVYLWSSTSRD